MTNSTQYRFSELLGQYPKEEFKEKLTAFAKTLDVTTTHAYHLMRATWGNPCNLSIRKLILAAEFFGLSVDEIINHPSKAVPA